MKKILIPAICLLTVLCLAFGAAAAQKKPTIKYRLQKAANGQQTAELFVVLPVADPLGRPKASAEAMAYIQKHFPEAVRAGLKSPAVAKASMTRIGYLSPYLTKDGKKSYSRMHMLAEIKIKGDQFKALKSSSLDEGEVKGLLKKYATYVDQRRLGKAWNATVK